MGCSSSATMRKMNMRLVTVEVVVNSGRLVAMSKRERERERWMEVGSSQELVVDSED